MNLNELLHMYSSGSRRRASYLCTMYGTVHIQESPYLHMYRRTRRQASTVGDTVVDGYL